MKNTLHIDGYIVEKLAIQGYAIETLANDCQGKYLLRFRGFALCCRNTKREINLAMQQHYEERKLRNFSNMSLEVGGAFSVK